MAYPDEYTATIEGVEDDAICECDSCDWKGKFKDTGPIGDAILTPGDPSPAGRCPECDTLAYVVREKEKKMRISVDGGVTWIESKYLCVDIAFESGKSMTLSFENEGRMQADLWAPKDSLEVCIDTAIFETHELQRTLFDGA